MNVDAVEYQRLRNQMCLEYSRSGTGCYNCPYVVVIPFRNGNEYDEDYECDVTGKRCQGSKCDLTDLTIEDCVEKYKKLRFTGGVE